jgi:dihydroflavonol-4-reductase
MKVFVTGGTGFLGNAVIANLLASGHSVRAMVRQPRARLPEGAEAVEVSLLDRDGLAQAIDGCEAVMHLAGMVSRDPDDAAAMNRVHVEGTQALLDAMEGRSIGRLVLASTSGTIAVSKSARVATEVDEASISIIGRWPYYMSKRLQEQEVLSRDRADRVEAVLVNPSLLLGPGDTKGSSCEDVLRILHGRVPALTGGTAAFVDVRDCAPAFTAALERGRRGNKYLLNGANMKVRAFAERIALLGDVSMPRVKLSNRWANFSARLLEGVYDVVDRIPPVDPVSVEMSCHHWGCSAAKAERELGFSARDPGTTLRDTVRDLEERGLFRRR